MSKTKNLVIDQMNAANEREQSQMRLNSAEREQGRPQGNEQNEKRQAIQYLNDLMATIQAAHFKGRLHDCPLRVHEENDAGISIDLYHFEGDGKPVCKGLTFRCDSKQDLQRAFCISYDPDREHPVYILCFNDETSECDEDYDALPDTLPLAVLQNVTAWLEQQMKPAAQQKQETDFARAISDLQGVSLEALDRLHSAAHDVITELQGDMRLPEAAARIPILGHILTTELTAFKAYAVKYTKQNQNKQ